MRIVTILLLSFLFSLSISMHAQDTVKTREVIANYPGCQETYSVKLSDGHIWHGKFRYTYGKVLMIEGNYYNDMMDGEWKYYYTSGEIKYSVIYSKGVFVRTIGGYYPDGRIMCTDSVSGKKEIVKCFSNKSELTDECISFNGLWIRSLTYYPKSGKVHKVTGYSDADTSLRQVTTYYENGNVRSVLQTKGGVPYTASGCFDSAGKPIDQGGLKDGTGILKTYQDTSILHPESDIEYKSGKMDGYALYYHFNGKPGRKGRYTNNKQTGKWVYFTKAGHWDYEINFDLPARVREKEVLLPADRISYSGETQPEFPGGENNLFRFLKENLKYPRKALENEIQGTVFLSFEVNTDGVGEAPKVIHGVEEGQALAEEAIRVLKLMPRWMPGFMNGRPVKVMYSLPVTFQTRR
jgi:antitoxin component YwqK of YwqJK toxin-antitoxin module